MFGLCGPVNGTYGVAHSCRHLSAVSRRPSKREGDRGKESPHPSVPETQALQTYAVNGDQSEVFCLFCSSQLRDFMASCNEKLASANKQHRAEL